MLDAATQEMLVYAIRDSGGREICGFLLRDRAGYQRYYGVSNLAYFRGEFLVSNCDVRRIKKTARDRNLEILAFIHSHRRDLDLSPGDINGFRATKMPWIVVALTAAGLNFKIHYPQTLPCRMSAGAVT